MEIKMFQDLSVAFFTLVTIEGYIMLTYLFD